MGSSIHSRWLRSICCDNSYTDDSHDEWDLYTYSPPNAADGGTVYFSEDFESVQLGPVDSTKSSHTAIAGDVTTPTPPDGMVVDNTNMQTGGCRSFEGWNFWLRDSWSGLAEQREQFTKGSGVIAVADSDEYAMCGTGVRLFHSILKTPSIDVSSATAGSLELAFDSSFVPYDNMVMEVLVHYDGAFSHAAMSSTYAGYGPISTNDHIVIDLANLSGASSLVVDFIVREAYYDWFWAIDNIVITGIFATSLPPRNIAYSPEDAASSKEKEDIAQRSKS